MQAEVWDQHIHSLLERERESLLDVVGQALGEEIMLWDAIEKKLQVSVRLAILEQSGLSARPRHVAGKRNLQRVGHRRG